MAENKCRHSRSWLVANGHIEWCYECGAIRKMERLPPNIVSAVSGWARPVGKGGDNPYGKYRGWK